MLYLTISFWVCEKSDGLRVLVLIVKSPVTDKQEVYLVNRKNEFYEVSGVVFACFQTGLFSEGISEGRTDTLLDGELVVYVDCHGKLLHHLLLFDCMAIDGESLVQLPLIKRYARLRNDILRPYKCYLDNNKTNDPPFDVQVKQMRCAYELDSVLEGLANTKHNTDGLIFTNTMGGYNCGTDRRILKWKPPHETTIDLKLQLRFPPDLDADPQGKVPNYYAKPLFQLFRQVKGNTHEPFDYLEMRDEEWEQWKRSGEQLDDRIVECSWQYITNGPAHDGTWRIVRIRDDKVVANHRYAVCHILNTIKEGVNQEDLKKLIPAIRTSWTSSKREQARVRAQNKSASPVKAGSSKIKTCNEEISVGSSLPQREFRNLVSD